MEMWGNVSISGPKKEKRERIIMQAGER